jgi:hypothetical protein
MPSSPLWTVSLLARATGLSILGVEIVVTAVRRLAQIHDNYPQWLPQLLALEAEQVVLEGEGAILSVEELFAVRQMLTAEEPSTSRTLAKAKRKRAHGSNLYIRLALAALASLRHDWKDRMFNPEALTARYRLESELTSALSSTWVCLLLSL